MQEEPTCLFIVENLLCRSLLLKLVCQAIYLRNDQVSQLCLLSCKKETKSPKICIFVSHFNSIVSNEQIDIGNL